MDEKLLNSSCMIYLDNNATAQPSEEVIEAIADCLRNKWQNPSAGYSPAKYVREAVEEARQNVAELVGAHPDEITFTSGGTEATNTILNTWIFGRIKSELNNAQGFSGDECPTIVTLTSEHPATLKTLEAGRLRGKCRTMHIEVDHKGQPLLEVWDEALENATGATFCMGNNETGVIVPYEQMVDSCHGKGVPVHVDAVQVVGKIPLNLTDIEADYASISSHKIHGPKGVGALYIKRGKIVDPLIFGGGQEFGRRSGTTNVPGIVGFGVAARIAMKNLREEMERVRQLRDMFESELLSHLTDVVINGKESLRLPNTSNITFLGCPSEGMMLLLEKHGICCSVASACKAGNNTPSSVLTAMGLTSDQAKSSLRFSLSVFNTRQEMEAALHAIISSVKTLRDIQSEQSGPVIVYKP